MAFPQRHRMYSLRVPTAPSLRHNPQEIRQEQPCPRGMKRKRSPSEHNASAHGPFAGFELTDCAQLRMLSNALHFWRQGRREQDDYGHVLAELNPMQRNTIETIAAEIPRNKVFAELVARFIDAENYDFTWIFPAAQDLTTYGQRFFNGPGEEVTSNNYFAQDVNAWRRQRGVVSGWYLPWIDSSSITQHDPYLQSYQRPPAPLQPAIQSPTHLPNKSSFQKRRKYIWHQGPAKMSKKHIQGDLVEWIRPKNEAEIAAGPSKTKTETSGQRSSSASLVSSDDGPKKHLRVAIHARDTGLLPLGEEEKSKTLGYTGVLSCEFVARREGDTIRFGIMQFFAVIPPEDPLAESLTYQISQFRRPEDPYKRFARLFGENIAEEDHTVTETVVDGNDLPAIIPSIALSDNTAHSKINVSEEASSPHIPKSPIKFAVSRLFKIAALEAKIRHEEEKQFMRAAGVKDGLIPDGHVPVEDGTIDFSDAKLGVRDMSKRIINFQTRQSGAANTDELLLGNVVRNWYLNSKKIFDWNNAKDISDLNKWRRQILTQQYESCVLNRPARLLISEKKKILQLAKDGINNSQNGSIQWGKLTNRYNKSMVGADGKRLKQGAGKRFVPVGDDEQYAKLAQPRRAPWRSRLYVVMVAAYWPELYDLLNQYGRPNGSVSSHNETVEEDEEEILEG